MQDRERHFANSATEIGKFLWRGAFLNEFHRLLDAAVTIKHYFNGSLWQYRWFAIIRGILRHC